MELFYLQKSHESKGKKFDKKVHKIKSNFYDLENLLRFRCHNPYYASLIKKEGEKVCDCTRPKNLFVYKYSEN